MDSSNNGEYPDVTERDVLRFIREALREGGGRHTATADCLDDDTIAALAEGALDAAARAAALPHLAGCRRCRAAVASVAMALADGPVARAARALAGGRFRTARFAIPAVAAAAAVLLLSWPPPTDRPESRHRAPTITTAPAPAPVSPIGEVAAARLLRWAAVDGADRYRVTVFDAEGLVRYEVEVTGTEVPLPDSVRLTPGRTYLWKVDARTDFDRWVSSPLIEFRVAGERR